MGTRNNETRSDTTVNKKARTKIFLEYNNTDKKQEYTRQQNIKDNNDILKEQILESIQKELEKENFCQFNNEKYTQTDELLSLDNSDTEDEYWQNNDEEYNLYQKDIDYSLAFKEDKNNDPNDDSSGDDSSNTDNSGDNTDSSNNNTDTTGTSSNFRNKDKELREANKKKLSKKTVEAIEEDEEEIEGVIDILKSKKIKTSKKSLDLQKFRTTFKEKVRERTK